MSNYIYFKCLDKATRSKKPKLVSLSASEKEICQEASLSFLVQYYDTLNTEGSGHGRTVDVFETGDPEWREYRDAM